MKDRVRRRRRTIRRNEVRQRERGIIRGRVQELGRERERESEGRRSLG